MTSNLATAQQLRNPPCLPKHDHWAAEAVASGLRDAKATNTARSYASAWRRIQAWAIAGDHPALPTTPQVVVLYLGHPAATGRAMAS